MSAVDAAAGDALAAPAAARSAARRYDIDLIRVSVCLIMFFFHVAKVFDFDPVYHVKNPDQSFAMTVFTTFVHRWAMPLFFFIAGWASAVMLARRSNGRFIPFFAATE